MIPVYAAPPAPSVSVKALVDRNRTMIARWKEIAEDGPDGNEPLGAVLRALEKTTAALSAQVQDVATFGPLAHLNGIHGLNEEYWTVTVDPHANDEETFSIPLYSLVDPFAAAPAKQEG